MAEDEAPPEKPDLRVVAAPKSVQAPTTHERYEQMATAYFAGARTIRGVVEALKKKGVHVGWKTVRKAIETGWPEHHWPPLKERAKLHDRAKEAEGNTADPARAERARGWIEMKRDYLVIAGGVRAGLARALNVLNQNIDRSVATSLRPQRQVHFEEVLDGKGKVVRRIPRTITVDVQVMPSVFDVSTALNQIAGALQKVGEGELGQLLAKPPGDAAGGKRSRLTDAQIEYIHANGGRLPDGVTPEMLGEF